jgi:hypothetical protein
MIASDDARAEEEKKKEEEEPKAGYSLLLYPFQHCLPDGGAGLDLDTSEPLRTRRPSAEPKTSFADSVLRNLGKVWEPWLRRALRPGMAADELSWEVDDSYFLLPAARALMYPDLVHLSTVERTEPDFIHQIASKMRERLEVAEDDLSGWCGPHLPVDIPGSMAQGGPGSRPCVMRLTLRSEKLEHYESLEIDIACSAKQNKRPPEWVPLRMSWVDLLLFPQGIGFLVMRVDHDLSWDHDTRRRFSREVKKVWAPKINLPSALLRLKGEPVRWTNILEYMLSPAVHRRGDKGEALLSPNRERSGTIDDAYLLYTTSETAQSLGTNFTFVHVVFDEARAPSSSPEHTSDGRPRLDSLIELITGEQLSDQDWAISETKLNELSSKNNFSYWGSWDALAWWGSLAVSAQRSDFMQETWHGNWSRDYLHVILITLFQRTRMLKFLDELDRGGSDLEKERARARDLAGSVREFHNDFWFNSITVAPLGGALYRHLQQSYELADMFAAVQQEMKLVDDYLVRHDHEEQAAATERLTRTVTIITVTAPVLTFVLALASEQLVIKSHWFVSRAWWQVALGSVVVVLLSGFVLYRLVRTVLKPRSNRPGIRGGFRVP